MLNSRIDYGQSAAEYHRDPAWGSSSLKAMRKGPPARVMWERENPHTSDAMALGTALHCMVLTPAIFSQDYAVKPDGMSFATKDGKSWREANTKPFILTHAEANTLTTIHAALHAKPLVALSLENCETREVSLFWEQNGEQVKGRPDWIGGGYIHDLKLSRYGGPQLAFRAFVEGWMHQAAHYRAGALACGLGEMGCRLVVVAPKDPHYVWTIEIKPDALDLIAIENAQTIYALGQHRQANHWPGTPDEWVKIEPPASVLITNTVLDNLPEVEDIDG